MLQAMIIRQKLKNKENIDVKHRFSCSSKRRKSGINDFK